MCVSMFILMWLILGISVLFWFWFCFNRKNYCFSKEILHIHRMDLFILSDFYYNLHFFFFYFLLSVYKSMQKKKIFNTNGSFRISSCIESDFRVQTNFELLMTLFLLSNCSLYFILRV